MQFEQVLRTWSEWFEAQRLRYALTGGNALRAWGHQRSTYDVDFVVDGTQQSRIIAHAESLGYLTTHASGGYSNHHHRDAALGHIDFMYVYGTTADQVFDGAVQLSLTGIPLPVVRPEHLIAMKVRAMKNSPMRVLIDAPDIAFLLGLPETDQARVRDYFSEHGLLKIYDELEKERR